MGILANNEGKILRSNQTGSVLKQNYNFGKAFASKEAFLGEIYFNSSDIIGKDLSIFIRIKQDSRDKYYSDFIIYSEGTDINSISSCFSDEKQSLVIYKNGVKSSLDNYTTYYYSEEVFVITVSKDSLPQFSGTVTFRLFQGYHYLYFSGNNLTVLEGLNLKFQHVAFLNRIVTEGEANYYYNNLLGNELLSTRGLFCEIKSKKATIVGSDIAIEGYNNNLILKNLPTGTLQEQLDYANDNLFEAW